LGDVYVQSRLENAFEFDFEEIFKCGKDVDVWFRVSVLRNNEILHREHFVHKVVYNPMKQIFFVSLQEQQFETECQTMEELKTLLSGFSTTIDMPVQAQLGDELEVVLTSYLTSVSLTSIEEKLELMILWEYTEPTSKKKFIVGDYET